MVSERVQRQIDALLDRAEAAIAEADGQAVTQSARGVIAIGSENGDAHSFLAIAEAAGGSALAQQGSSVGSAPTTPSAPTAREPVVLKGFDGEQVTYAVRWA